MMQHFHKISPERWKIEELKSMTTLATWKLYMLRPVQTMSAWLICTMSLHIK